MKKTDNKKPLGKFLPLKNNTSFLDASNESIVFFFSEHLI